MNRCPECGSWGVQCANDAPVNDCGCARCLRERLRILLNAELPQLRDKIKRLEKRIAELEAELRVAEAFHKVAVSERDYERKRISELEGELAMLRSK